MPNKCKDLGYVTKVTFSTIVIQDHYQQIK